MKANKIYSNNVAIVFSFEQQRYHRHRNIDYHKRPPVHLHENSMNKHRGAAETSIE